MTVVARRPAAWLAFAALACLIAFGAWIAQAKWTIVAFRQAEDSVVVEFDSTVPLAGYVVLPDVPERLDVASLRMKATLVPPARSIRVPLQGEPTGGEYSVVLFVGSAHIELVRQSAAWLKSTFSFERAGGYTILGRRSVAIDSRQQGSTSVEAIRVANRPRPLNVRPVGVSPYPEINAATGLLRKLWSEPVRQGPTNLPYDEFLAKPFEEKLRLIRRGDYAVMCQGFRDLFAHAAIAARPKVHVRLVDAMNYGPELPDLISYSHATAEVWVEALRKWVLFDPWLGIMVRREDTPLSAEELMRNARGAEIQAVLPSIPRMYQEESGQVVDSSFSPASVQLEEFTCQKLGCSPGYSEYFEYITIRELAVQGEAS